MRHKHCEYLSNLKAGCGTLVFALIFSSCRAHKKSEHTRSPTITGKEKETRRTNFNFNGDGERHWARFCYQQNHIAFTSLF
jgi:hypothetical protein